MSNEMLEKRIKLLKGAKGATAEKVVSRMLCVGQTSILADEQGHPLKFADLSDPMKIVVVTACEEFVHYNGHGSKSAPFMERHDNAMRVAESLVRRLEGTGVAGCPFVHRLSDETINDGLNVFSDLIIAQAHVDLPNCFRDADVTAALERVRNHGQGKHSSPAARPARRGERPSRSLMGARH